MKKDKVFIIAEVVAISGCSSSVAIVNQYLQTCVLTVSLIAGLIAIYRSLKKQSK